jgi:hypothetical protein
MDVEHVSNVLDTMESCPTYFYTNLNLHSVADRRFQRFRNVE